MQKRLAAVLLLVVAAVACGGGDPERQVTVFAAASLTDVFPQIDPSARYSFAGSDELATQIRAGAPADVYAAANPRYPAKLFTEGVVEEPAVFASNRLVLVVPRGNPADIGSVEDLSEARVELVVGAAGVPVGDYARELLTSLELESVLANVVSNEQDAKGVVGKVALGEADAGLVYATDTASAAAEVEVIELPAEAQPPIEYEIAVVAGSENAEAARAFVERVLGPEGRAALERAGFTVP